MAAEEGIFLMRNLLMPGGVRPSREGLRDPKDGGGRAVLGTKSAHIPNVFMQCVCATSTEDLRSDVLAPSKGVAVCIAIRYTNVVLKLPLSPLRKLKDRVGAP